ncbi:pentapeptide repeat-containing protein [Microbacterium sp. NPDC076911]|uniref:pentapeptide repeat-containing protein n=1 Tax=Microbacterium sp. NPDC076911 TaxID=3154958 RepID=UPI00341E1793
MPISREAPRVVAPVLPELESLVGTELRPHTRYEAMNVAGADLSGMHLDGLFFDECRLSKVKGMDVSLRGLTLTECLVDQIDLPVLTAGRSEVRGVQWQSSRIGSADLFDSSLQRVQFIDCRLGFVNLRGARLEDVRFTNCTIDELDLGAATAKRVEFVDTAVGSLDVTAAKLQAFDLRGADLSSITGVEYLRGAIINAHQLVQLSAAFAEHVGVSVRD